MPRDLAALLAEDGAAPADAVERALARQREAGGALDTALLEVGAVSEEVLVPLLARAAGVPAAPEGAWSAADARARRVFPSRVAERHGLAPFALDGRELSLVATYPVDVALLDEISFMLSLHLTAHVGPEWRVRELIHRLYGSPLAPRLAALASRSGGPVYAASTGPASIADLPAPEEPPPPPPPTGFQRDDSEPLEPLAAALEQALDEIDISIEEEPPEPERPEPAADAAAEPEPPRAPPDRTAPPRWTLDQARAALAAAQDRDEVVLAALRYARDFFEFAAVFAVTRDAIAGHDALGSDDARERARAVAIWAADAGMFRIVLETRSPYLGPVSPDVPSNQTVLSGLGRKMPRAALVCPVILRDRPVCVLYADNGEAPVSARRLGDLLLFLSTIGAALERIIRDRKRRPRRRAPADAAAPPAAAGGAAAAQAAAGPAQDAGATAAGGPSPEPTRDAASASPADEIAAASPEAVAAPPPEPGRPEPPAAAEVGPGSPQPSLDAAPPPAEARDPGAAAPPEPAPAVAPDAIAAAVASFDVEVEVDASASGEVAPPEPEPRGPDPEPAAAAAPAAPEPSPATAWRRTPPAASLDDIERQFFGVDDPWSTRSAEPGAQPPAPAPPDREEPPAPGEPQEPPAPAAAGAREPAPAAGAPEAPAAEAPEAPAAEAQEAPAAAPAAEPPAAIEPAPPPAAAAPAPAAGAPDAPERGQAAPPPEEPRATLTPAPLHEPLPVPVEPARPAPAPAQPETPAALADRALDPDLSVAATACETLASRRRDPTLRPAHEKLRRALLSGISSRATRAALALEALRDVEAIPLLVQVLETSEPETARAAANALSSITLQRLGTDARKWLAWWKQNRGRGRAEWLFSGLTSADRDTRALAEAELRQAGDAPVEYSPDMPAPDRERAARAWAGWLARSGHVL